MEKKFLLDTGVDKGNQEGFGEQGSCVRWKGQSISKLPSLLTSKEEQALSKYKTIKKIRKLALVFLKRRKKQKVKL